MININKVISNLTKNPNLDETFGGWFGPYVLGSAGSFHDRTSMGMCFPVHRGCSYECPAAGLN